VQNLGNEQAGEEMGLGYLVEYLMQGHYGLPIMAWPEPYKLKWDHQQRGYH
jgi:aromatic ring-cleaving dioxygenase